MLSGPRCRLAIYLQGQYMHQGPERALKRLQGAEMEANGCKF